MLVNTFIYINLINDLRSLTLDKVIHLKRIRGEQNKKLEKWIFSEIFDRERWITNTMGFNYSVMLQNCWLTASFILLIAHYSSLSFNTSWNFADSLLNITSPFHKYAHLLHSDVTQCTQNYLQFACQHDNFYVICLNLNYTVRQSEEFWSLF